MMRTPSHIYLRQSFVQMFAVVFGWSAVSPPRPSTLLVSRVQAPHPRLSKQRWRIGANAEAGRHHPRPLQQGGIQHSCPFLDRAFLPRQTSNHVCRPHSRFALSLQYHGILPQPSWAVHISALTSRTHIAHSHPSMYECPMPSRSGIYTI